MSVPLQPFRVLSLDGGGMRGVYTAQYLAALSDGFTKNLHCGRLDVGKGFDLIVGTSTGSIVAAALAAAVPLDEVITLYRKHGPSIFPRRLPTSISVDLAADLKLRPKALKKGSAALQAALRDCFGDETVGQLFARRGIALCITAVHMSNHKSWVFKTPHLGLRSNHRDDNYSLVDVCLASSAAPIYRSVAAIQVPGTDGIYDAFIDGGLWANNPVLVALIEALEFAPPERPIEVFALGTCPRPAGTQVQQGEVHRGLLEWKFGAEAAAMAIDAQESAFDFMADFLTRHLKRECHIIRFPREPVPYSMMQYLELDDTRGEASQAIRQQARTDADMTFSRTTKADDADGARVKALFEKMPERPGNSS